MSHKRPLMRQAFPEELHQQLVQWLGDLDFYNDELRFMNRLVDKYFIWLIHDDSLPHLRELAERMGELTRQRASLARSQKKLLQEVEMAMTEQSSRGDLARECDRLEDSLHHFTREWRSLKRELFQTTEKVIKEEKLKRLLGP